MAYYLSGTIRVPGCDLEAVHAALPEHIRLTLAEPGCVAFEVAEQSSGFFLVHEVFQDEPAFKAHQERAVGSDWARASSRAVRDYKTWTHES